MEAVSDITDFIRCYEQDFLNLIQMRNTVGRESDIQALKSTILNGNKRIKEIDRNISSLFEKNVSGMISDERFMMMTAEFETEQRSLKKAVADAEEQRQSRARRCECANASERVSQVFGNAGAYPGNCKYDDPH